MAEMEPPVASASEPPVTAAQMQAIGTQFTQLKAAVAQLKTNVIWGVIIVGGLVVWLR